jgi:hypothetical protein
MGSKKGASKPTMSNRNLHAMGFAIRLVLVGEKHENWQTNMSKVPSSNGNATASAGRNSIFSSVLNFCRANSSIGGLRSLATRR